MDAFVDLRLHRGKAICESKANHEISVCPVKEGALSWKLTLDLRVQAPRELAGGLDTPECRA